MIKKKKIILAATISVSLLFGYALFTDNARYGQWTLKTSGDLGWNSFFGAGDSAGGRYHEKMAMFVPARIGNLKETFVFQFDLGSAMSVLYDNTLNGIAGCSGTVLRSRIKRLKSPILFWNRRVACKQLALSFDSYTALTENCYIMPGYGGPAEERAGRPLQLGTIGADMFRDKVLIIDYPNERYAVCDSVPQGYCHTMTAISLDAWGRPVLPLTIGGHSYRVLFDNGSSIFPLMAKPGLVSELSGSAPTDTVRISSWGEERPFIGRPLQANFVLAGRTYDSTVIYTDLRPEQDEAYDLIAGNALFWDRKVIIDFKKKQFGIM